MRKGHVMLAVIALLSVIMPIMTPTASYAVLKESTKSSIEVPVEIELLGEDAEDVKVEFDVLLKADDEDNPMPKGSTDGEYVLTIVGAGEDTIPEIPFREVGEYEYTLRQINMDVHYIDYDTTVYELRVYVTNSEDNGIEVAATLRNTDDEAKCPEAIFTNVIIPPLDPTPPVTSTPMPTPTPSMTPTPTTTPPPGYDPDAPTTGTKSVLYVAVVLIAVAVMSIACAEIRKRRNNP